MSDQHDCAHTAGYLAVCSQVLPDRTYGVRVSLGADYARALTADEAVAYAVSCHQMAVQAEHATAMMRLLVTAVRVTPASASQFLSSSHASTPAQHKGTDPIHFRPGVAHAMNPGPGDEKYLPRLCIELNGAPMGDLSPDELRAHGEAVLCALASSLLNTRVARVLTRTGQFGPDAAAALIGDLVTYWPIQATPPEDGTPRTDTVRHATGPSPVFVLTCDGCELDIPFGTEAERDTWTEAHTRATGHTVRNHAQPVQS